VVAPFARRVRQTADHKGRPYVVLIVVSTLAQTPRLD
jgi:hypothetical protein